MYRWLPPARRTSANYKRSERFDVCTTIEIKDREEANSRFAELLAEGDFEGALGVAQVLWAVCPSRWVFEDCISEMQGELSFRHPVSHLPEVQHLGKQLLGLKVDHADEHFMLAA
jgi:hypothetical protein